MAIKNKNTTHGTYMVSLKGASPRNNNPLFNIEDSLQPFVKLKFYGFCLALNAQKKFKFSKNEIYFFINNQLLMN